MAEMRTQDALTLEADLLGHTLRGDVVRIGDEVQPLQPALVERPPR